MNRSRQVEQSLRRRAAAGPGGGPQIGFDHFSHHGEAGRVGLPAGNFQRGQKFLLLKEFLPVHAGTDAAEFGDALLRQEIASRIKKPGEALQRIDSLGLTKKPGEHRSCEIFEQYWRRRQVK